MLKVGKNLMMLALALSLTIGVVLAGVLLSSACGAPATAPPETITITPPPETITITLTQRITNVTPEEASALIQENLNNYDFVIIDVRTVQEFAGGSIENAANMDYYSATFRDDLDKLDRGKVYLIYCQTGIRSGPTLAIMEELGFLEVYHLSSGIVAWNAEGLPVVTE